MCVTLKEMEIVKPIQGPHQIYSLVACLSSLFEITCEALAKH